MKSNRPRSSLPDLRVPILAALLSASCLLGWSRMTSRLHGGESTPRADARSTDVDSIDGIIAALYDSISGPAGGRDWDRLRGLFLQGARLIPCRRLAGGKGAEARVLSVEEFIQLVTSNVRNEGFFEKETHRKLDRFGATAHVFSTYESRHALADPQPFARGINSIQLFFDGKRWWVVTVYWDTERPDQPIPEQYLPGKS